MDSDRRAPAPFNLDIGRNKRRHSQMEAGHRHSHSGSPSPLFVRRDSTPSEPHASPPLPHIHLPPIASHFPRDGFDYRRPINTMNPAPTDNFIDLTSDDDDDDRSAAPSLHHTSQPGTPPARPRQRLPRYGREIIDLSVATSPPRSEPPADHPPPVRLSSPEVEFVSSRPLSRAEQRPNRLPLPPFLDPEARRPIINLTAENEEDDDLVTLGSRGGLNLPRPQGAGSVATIGALARMVQEVGRRGLRQTQTWAMRPHWPGHAHDDSALVRLVGAAGLPRPNYEAVAFDLGVDNETPRLPTPKYSPPPPAPHGFTRDPTEDDTLVCPNCEDELAVGETEEKRQVWIVKACGHVYCGTCIQNRKNKRTKNPKGKGRASDPILPEPFAFCRAADCGHTRVSHKADVMQIYF